MDQGIISVAGSNPCLTSDIRRGWTRLIPWVADARMPIGDLFSLSAVATRDSND